MKQEYAIENNYSWDKREKSRLPDKSFYGVFVPCKLPVKIRSEEIIQLEDEVELNHTAKKSEDQVKRKKSIAK